MKKKFVCLMLLLPVASLAATLHCPTVAEINQIFHDCKVDGNQQSCQSALGGTEWVLDSPVAVIYGGEHAFPGFTQFKAMEVLSGNVVCKYGMSPVAEKMGWIIGSRHALKKSCHIDQATSVLGISSCKNVDPKKCKITCH